MGPGLADGISQGQAGPDEFRTAPLWGLGKRAFFLHDGRTSDLVVAIHQHRSGPSAATAASEANAVINNFDMLPDTSQQDLLNFLRSLSSGLRSITSASPDLSCSARETVNPEMAPERFS